MSLLPSLSVWAEDASRKTFTAKNEQGVEILYLITSGGDPRTVAVTSEADGFYAGDVAIPAEVTNPADGTEYAVTAIGRKAFNYCAELTSVSLPASIRSIGVAAFQECDGLTSVDIPDGVARIDSGIFIYCDRLVRVGIPASVTSIGFQAFSNCVALASIDLPEGVTAIGEAAFSQCTSLTSVHLPEGLTGIGIAAFDRCAALADLTFPSTLRSIGQWAFAYSGLTSVSIPEGVTTIEEGVFDTCTKLARVDLPGSLTEIKAQAFNLCASLTSVHVPEGVTTIGEMAFGGCASLTAMELPSTLTESGYAAFQLCPILTGIDLPGKLRTIGEGAFFGCESLTSMHIPASLTEIGRMAFYRCEAIEEYSVDGASQTFSSADGILYDKACTALLAFPLKRASVDIPATVTRLGAGAFALSKLTSLTIPAGVTEIDGMALEGCADIESLHVADGNPAFTVVDGTLYDKDMRTLVFYQPRRTSISIPASVTRIGAYALSHTSLTEIDLPDGIDTIEEGAFQLAPRLTSVTLGKGVRSIGKAVFWSTPIESLTIRADKAPRLEEDIYIQQDPILIPLTVHVPNAALQSYLDDEAWGRLKNSITFQGYAPGDEPATGIEPPAATTAGSRAYAADGALHVEATRPLTVTVSTFAGATLISERPLPAGHNRLTGLPAGPVIVKLSDGTTVKLNNRR